MKQKSILIIIALLTVFGCTNNNQDLQGSSKETVHNGSATIYVDAEIIRLFDVIMPMYAKESPNANITLAPCSVDSTMLGMINHTHRGLIMARDYSEEELATIKNANIELPRTHLANDALVFYSNNMFPSDTLTAMDIEQWYIGKEVNLSGYPKLTKAPIFVVPGKGTSVMANFVTLVGKKQTISSKYVRSLPNTDDVYKAVQNDNSLIGVGYLSQLAKDQNVKLLKVSFTNAKGEFIRPKPVHAAYLIQGQLPYIVPIYFVLRDKPNMYNLPSGFMQFIARTGTVQKTFLDAGIEPAYAKFNLIEQEK